MPDVIESVGYTGISCGFLITLATVVFTGMFFSLSEGLYLNDKTVVFVHGFRISRIPIDRMKRIGIVFHQEKNGCYSAAVKLVLQDGKAINKDYSKQFQNLKMNKRFVMFAYTIPEQQTHKIADRLSDKKLCSFSWVNTDDHTV